MKIRDLTELKFKKTARDRELDKKQFAPWAATKQGVSNLSKSFGKGFGPGVGVAEPNKDTFRRTPGELGQSPSTKPQAKAKPQAQTGTYQKKGINPELEKALAQMTPEQQQEILNQIKQGKL